MKADFNIDHQWYEAIQGAEVIRLTDGTEFVKKEVATKIMAKYGSEEYNKAIDACIDSFCDSHAGTALYQKIKQQLESLKIKQ